MTYLRNCRKSRPWIIEESIISDHDFVKTLPITNDSIILDVGCGLGRDMRVIKKMHPNSQIYGIDTMNYYNGSYPGAFMTGSILNLPFSDKFFDIAYANGVFAHLDESQIFPAISEMSRVAHKIYYTEIIDNNNYQFVKINDNTRA